jgi:hypothetical protein
VRTRIAIRIVAKRLHPLLPSPISERLLRTRLGRRAMRAAIVRKIDARTTPRGH